MVLCLWRLWEINEMKYSERQTTELTEANISFLREIWILCKLQIYFSAEESI